MVTVTRIEFVSEEERVIHFSEGTKVPIEKAWSRLGGWGWRAHGLVVRGKTLVMAGTHRSMRSAAKAGHWALEAAKSE